MVGNQRKPTEEMTRGEMADQINHLVAFMDEESVRRVLDATIQINAHAGYVGDDYQG